MFEYHGWVTVHESATDDDDPVRQAEIVEALQRRVDEIAGPCLLDLRRMNGELFLHFGGFSNHRAPEILDLFRYVGTVAPGSYGLLHVRDDEDPRHENEVRVLRLVRGNVTQHTESSLSPCVPVLEDPFGG
ncbi:immunity protein 7 of polymorphic toxin system [Streptomyces sp. CG 926]|uniref:Imm7 family immunity protein n=1 Tax=unclassified Streptomyces TaxID=2593676 RepID=UPI000D6BDF41|nr:Imm7 family immunity protein [Streptomyces sp. CG 926]PWK64744.1 immunity protein 7 of polymorphic toxin system [Streptomyces sp. CG 926]